MEFSAVIQKNLKEAFDSAIFAAIKHKACEKAKKLKLFDRAKTFSIGGWKKFFCFMWSNGITTSIQDTKPSGVEY